MSRADWDFESEQVPCFKKPKVIFYLASISLLLLGSWIYHWFYIHEMVSTIDNQTQLIRQYEEKNQLYEKMTKDMESAMHKQAKLINNMGSTLDQQDHLLKEFSIEY